MINLRLNASDDKINIQKEAEYFIKQNQRYMETQQKLNAKNKLSLEYILPQSNKEKLFGKFIPFTAKIYPDAFNEGMRYANTQYSSIRVRNHKKQFFSRSKHIENPEKYQEIKKYANILSQRKRKLHQPTGGGLDSFWMFKKVQKKEQTKKGKTSVDGFNVVQIQHEPSINRAQVAFKRILVWGKQSPDSLISKNLFKNYISSKLGQNFASWFLNFYQFRAYTTFQQFEKVRERFKSMTIRESHVVTFFLYDNNADSFVCAKDLFVVFENQFNQMIQKDVLKIAQFAKKNIGRKQGTNQEFKIEHVVIRDDWLTVKDYEMYFKKLQEPYLRATNKKDTVFSKTFAVLDHRQKVRSVRKQMNQKKTMYDELYGQLANERKNFAFIQQDDYKLNYSFLYEIFKEKSSQLFKYCCDFIFYF